MARNGVNLACAARSRRLARDPDALDGHVVACLQCQADAVRYRTLSRHLAALRTELVVAPGGFEAFVRSGLGDAPPMPKKVPNREAAVAAVGLAAVAGALAFWRRNLSA